MPLTVIPVLVLVAALSACATVARSPSAPPPTHPDCSFRAVTSCWTPTARFPSLRAQPADSAPRRILSPPAGALAAVTDSQP